ncbi:MAG: bifunctional helix-turn-helix domain-containing protein/methylated-DNA--[protein]-cysteine S-methyltransferase [Neomegalonema sp.]|nr:bifunctional helix-turn-helix domain-containing protein/methylated-DNA--[protein]-cysteine S-methyltransferase [Neomegalonema sp.]
MTARDKDPNGEEQGALYDIMAAALRHLEETAEERPSLEQVAARIGYSPTHFQRLFSRWVGVSPKKYVSYLALGHAKQMLAERRTMLETAEGAGLSSAGRLYDLVMKWEAMSPGVYASGGEGLDIAYGWLDSPFGDALAMTTPSGLCGLAFASECGREAAFADLVARWPRARYVEAPQTVADIAGPALGGGGGVAQLALIGAPFQIKVWEALLRVPSGYVTTYTDIATAIDRPKAVRAVGTAVGRNPISWLIPCHRALRKSGLLGGYHWGLTVKRAMLAYECARADAEPIPAS